MKIDINKKYKTVNGLEVDILKIYSDNDIDFPVKAFIYRNGDINNGTLNEYTMEGKYQAICPEHEYLRNLVEIKPDKD